MIEQKKTCVFAGAFESPRTKKLGCSALNKYYCEKEECTFYKSKDKYYLDDDLFPIKKEA